jgi:hypothetical protein
MCLGKQYFPRKFCGKYQSPPYVMGPHGVNLRERATPSSGSVGLQSKFNSAFDYGSSNRRKEERLAEQQEAAMEKEKEK